MKKIKLITQLKTLEKDEIIALGKYLHSPFFNTNPHICNLYNYLVDFYPSFEGMDRVAMRTKTFPGQEADSKALSTLMWQFCKVMEDFLIHSELKKDSVKRGILLKDNYRRRNLNEEFEVVLFSLLDKPNVQAHNSFESKVQRLCLLNEYLFEVTRSYYKKNIIKEYALPEFEECLNFLHSYGQVNIPWILPHLDRDKLTKTLKYDYTELPVEFQKMQDSVSKNNPIVGIISTLLKINNTKIYDKTALNSLKEVCDIYIEFGHTLTLMEQRKLYIMINNTANQFSALKTQAFRISFQTVKYAIENEIIGRKGFFDENTLNNVIVIGGAAREDQFVEDFINKKYKILPVKDQENERLLALAHFYFRVEKFDETIFYLEQASLVNPYRKTIFKSVLVRSHYELYEKDINRFDLMYSAIRSFDRLLKRSATLEDKVKIPQQNFLAVLKKLIVRRKSNKIKQNQIEELKNLLDSFSTVKTYEWLLKKIQNLEIEKSYGSNKP